MAFNKKNKRKITVGENVFYWTCKYSYPQDILRLTVMTDEKTHSRLVCEFKYKDFYLYFKELATGELKYEDLFDHELLKITNGVLTPWLVRQFIDIGLRKGWQPLTREKDFVITDIVDTIDINLWTESTIAERQSKI